MILHLSAIPLSPIREYAERFTSCHLRIRIGPKEPEADPVPKDAKKMKDKFPYPTYGLRSGRYRPIYEIK